MRWIIRQVKKDVGAGGTNTVSSHSPFIVLQFGHLLSSHSVVFLSERATEFNSTRFTTGKARRTVKHNLSYHQLTASQGSITILHVNCLLKLEIQYVCWRLRVDFHANPLLTCSGSVWFPLLLICKVMELLCFIKQNVSLKCCRCTLHYTDFAYQKIGFDFVWIWNEVKLGKNSHVKWAADLGNMRSMWIFNDNQNQKQFISGYSNGHFTALGIFLDVRCRRRIKDMKLRGIQR